MARKCRFKSCRSPLPKKADCTDVIQREGFCGNPCLWAHVDARREQAERRRRERVRKEDRALTRKQKEAIKTRPQLAREAQTEFNAYIRLRDEGRPCISCGRNHQGQWHAGHYRTVKAASSLRYHPLNCHRQCMPCNAHLSGNVVEYRINLVNRIGADRVECLESQNGVRRYSAQELRRIKRIYRKRAKLYQKIRQKNVV